MNEEVSNRKLHELRVKGLRNSNYIVISDGEDDRVIQAAMHIYNIADTNGPQLILLGNEEAIKRRFNKVPPNVMIRNPLRDKESNHFHEMYREKLQRNGKHLDPEQTFKRIQTNEYFAAFLLETGQADGMLGGSSVPTAQVLRAGLDVIGLKTGTRTVSGAFVMLLNEQLPGGQDAIVFTDSAVIPDPDADQLVDIASNAAEIITDVMAVDPVIAFVSFSTKGSAEHASLEKIREAVRKIKHKRVGLRVDGELQVDAAVIPEVAAKKDPHGCIAGEANVLVFPDLNAGNIAYKLVERVAKAKALGVILSGFAKPINDLSRGCSVQDIMDMICVTSLQGFDALQSPTMIG